MLAFRLKSAEPRPTYSSSRTWWAAANPPMSAASDVVLELSDGKGRFGTRERAKDGGERAESTCGRHQAPAHFGTEVNCSRGARTEEAPWHGSRKGHPAAPRLRDLEHTETALQVFARPHHAVAILQNKAPPLSVGGQLRNVTSDCQWCPI